MSQKNNKKRKINAESSGNSTSEQEYSYSPIRLRSVETDLEAIPRDILLRALVNYSKSNIEFFGGFNEWLEKATRPGTPVMAHEINFYDFLVEDRTPNAYELEQYSPKKIRDHVVELFAKNTYNKPEPYNNYDDEEEVDRREQNYNRLVKLLEELIERAEHLSDAGENASAYIILRVMQEVATLGKFESNGDIYREDDDDDEGDEEESLDLDISPVQFVDELSCRVDEVKKQLSDPEFNYCSQKLAELQAILPKEENNQEAFDAFPVTSDRVRSLFDDKSYSRSHEYVGRFRKVASSIQLINNQKVYEVHAHIAAVSMSGYYRQKITFTSQSISEYTCSCPMGRCKHLAALMTQICSQKTRPTVHNNMPQYIQYPPNTSYYYYQ